MIVLLNLVLLNIYHEHFPDIKSLKAAPVTKPPPKTRQSPSSRPLASQRSVPPARLLLPLPSTGRFHLGKGIISNVRFPEPPLF